MRRTWLILIGFTVLVCARGVLADGQMMIKGYGSGEYAIKGEVEENLNELIRHMEIGIGNSDQKLHIWVEGYADNTGPEAENDEWGEKRANQIKSFLSGKFPDAKIESITRGTSRNMRAVFVEWKYVSFPAPVVPAPTDDAKSFEQYLIKERLKVVMIFIIAALGGGAMIIFLLPSLLRKAKKAKSQPRFSWIVLKVDGKKFFIKIESKNGKFVSPFKTASGIQVVRDDLKGLIDSLKGCLKKNEFTSQREELIRRGIIKVKTELV